MTCGLERSSATWFEMAQKLGRWLREVKNLSESLSSRLLRLHVDSIILFATT
jgi:hypothetical protein